MTPLRLALADDQALVRSGLRALLSAWDDLQVEVEAADGAGLLDALQVRPVDVVLSDVRMPGLNGMEALRAIKELGVKAFDAQQRARMNLLGVMLDEFDEGRSKSYCCSACALLPVDELETALAEARREADAEAIAADDRKSRAKVLHRVLDGAAARLGIDLKLRRR